MQYDLEHVPEGNTNRTEVTDVVDVKKQGAKLGQTISDGIVLLPFSFEYAQSRNDLVYAAGTATVKKLLIQAGLTVAKL